MYFNNIPVSSTSVHKHLVMLLDDKLSYEHHLKSVLNKVKKTMATDYGDIVYGRAFNESFHKYLEFIQYNAAIAITGAIRGTSSEKRFQELGLESLKSSRWLRKLCLFYKIFHKKSPSYLFQLIPPNNNVYATRSSQSNKISSFKTRKTPFFQRLLFSYSNI